MIILIQNANAWLVAAIGANQIVSQDIQKDHPLSASDLQREATTCLVVFSFKFGPIKLHLSVNS